MPVSTDIVFTSCLLNPLNTSSTLGGGANTSNFILNTNGELFPTLVANPAGGATITQYGKAFLYNISSVSATLNSVQISIANALQPVGATNIIYLLSSDALDNNTLLARVIGYNNLGNPDFEEIPLNGTSPVVGQKGWNSISNVEIRTNNPAKILTTSTGQITVAMGPTGGTTLGYIPPKNYGAIGEINIGLAATLNDTLTTPDALTAPTGIVFSLPIPASPLNSPANIPYLNTLGIWYRVNLLAGILNDPQVPINIQVDGQ